MAVLVPGVLFGDPLLSRAQQREKAGDREAATQLYGSWLSLNPGAPGSLKVFVAYFRLEQDSAKLLAKGDAFVSASRGIPGTGEQIVRVAQLFELSGRMEQSRDFYLRAFEEGGGTEALISAFLLSLEMGDTASLPAIIDKLRERNRSSASLLDAVGRLRSGGDSAARADLLSSVDSSGDPDLSLKGLWVLYEVARNSGDAMAEAKARAGLVARFPGSPEAAIAASFAGTDAGKKAPGVLLFPGPDVFAGASKAQPAGASVARYAVQAGSFQVQENADYLAADLKKKGFAAVVRHETALGKDMFRVFAATGLEAEQARALQAKLADAGFSGFLVTEK